MAFPDKRMPISTGAILTAVVLCSSSAAAQEASNRLSDDLPPVGFGTLSQSDIGIRLQTPTLIVSIVPLAESVIRLLAADTYRSLHRLVKSKEEELLTESRHYGLLDPTLFLVSFFGTQPQARFDPEAITITEPGRIYRPTTILAISSSFGDRQVSQRETAVAIYLFEDELSLFNSFEVSYQGESFNQWARILRTIERERAAVDARAASGRRDTTSVAALRRHLTETSSPQ